MVLVKRGNVELEINEAYLDSYLAKGYDLITEKGKVISKGTPNEFNSLKLAYTEAQNTIAKLEKEKAVLMEEILLMQKNIDELNKKLKDKPKSDK